MATLSFLHLVQYIVVWLLSWRVLQALRYNPNKGLAEDIPDEVPFPHTPMKEDDMDCYAIKTSNDHIWFWPYNQLQRAQDFAVEIHDEWVEGRSDIDMVEIHVRCPASIETPGAGLAGRVNYNTFINLATRPNCDDLVSMPSPLLCWKFINLAIEDDFVNEIVCEGLLIRIRAWIDDFHQAMADNRIPQEREMQLVLYGFICELRACGIRPTEDVSASILRVINFSREDFPRNFCV